MFIVNLSTEFALVCETLKYENIINHLIETTHLITNEENEIHNLSILKVMIFELLFGNKKIQGGGAVKRLLMQNQDNLKAALQREMDKVFNPLDYSFCTMFAILYTTQSC